ncbi:hypothetical protein HNP86_002006 [Methanococcus maripaludis]|uniref:Uncharacterized protein n=1 Tax=Methanococcus maripaludis TaxID=39152 RepID=A0A7J9NX16_METMI|nr:hypothetical protein [Methanococcus maripaludis]MBA2851847.1 hypothetical protein [Methanococcus maripaludis]
MINVVLLNINSHTRTYRLFANDLSYTCKSKIPIMPNSIEHSIFRNALGYGSFTDIIDEKTGKPAELVFGIPLNFNQFADVIIFDKAIVFVNSLEHRLFKTKPFDVGIDYSISDNQIHYIDDALQVELLRPDECLRLLHVLDEQKRRYTKLEYYKVLSRRYHDW